MDIDVDFVSFGLGSIVTCVLCLIMLVFQFLGYRYPSFWFGLSNKKRRKKIIKDMYEELFGKDDGEVSE